MNMAQTFKPYLNQDYEKLRQECLKSKTLFVDKEFPPNTSSLYRKTIPNKRISWKRASEIVKNPQFIVDGIAPEDLDQGDMGDCWLIAAIASIATVPEYANVAIPKDQSFAPGEYAGIFHFRFWQYGEWYDVVVDDHLPVETKTSELVYCSNEKDKNEMFGPLIEKAYAKLVSHYENLGRGQMRDATTDLTGGVQQLLEFRKPLVKLVTMEEAWEAMAKAFLLKSLVGLSKINAKNGSSNADDQSGIMISHAHTCLGLYEILFNDGKYDKIREFTIDSDFTPKENSIRLVRCRNPWGSKVSYRGPWSNGTSEWNKVEPNIKDLLAPAKQNDGQFYMSFEDMFRIFDDLSFIHVNINAFYLKEYTFNKPIAHSKWITENYYGKWSPETSGAGNYWSGYQFRFEIKSKALVVLSLFQTDATKFKSEGKKYLACGVDIFKIKEPSVKKTKFSSNELVEIFSCDHYLVARENFSAAVLEPGSYVALLVVVEEGATDNFYLRIIIEQTTNQNSKVETVKPGENKPTPTDSRAKTDEKRPVESTPKETRTSKACLIL